MNGPMLFMVVGRHHSTCSKWMDFLLRISFEKKNKTTFAISKKRNNDKYLRHLLSPPPSFIFIQLSLFTRVFILISLLEEEECKCPNAHMHTHTPGEAAVDDATFSSRALLSSSSMTTTCALVATPFTVNGLGRFFFCSFHQHGEEFLLGQKREEVFYARVCAFIQSTFGSGSQTPRQSPSTFDTLGGP